MSTRKLEVVWTGDTKDFERSMSRVDKSAGKSEGRIGKLGKTALVGAAALGGTLVAGAVSCIKAFEESEKVGAQTNAVLKSTGGAAHVTAKEVGDLAGAISRKSGLDDEAVQSGENLLLTFTNIRNEAGRGNDIFSQTSNIMADMSVALGQDMKSSALQLGKALNDPIKGVTALQRVGVSFTAEQKEQIKGLVEHGHALDAQKLILHELSKEFGGSAKAAGDTFAGKLNKAKVAVGNVEEAIGGALVPVLADAAQGVADFVTGIQNGTGAGGKFRKIIEGVGHAVEPVVKGVVSFVGAIGDAFSGKNSGKATAFAKSVTGSFDGIRDAVTSIVHTLTPLVEGLFDFFVGVAKRQLPAMMQAIKGGLEVIRGVVEVFSSLLKGDFSGMWDGVKHIFSGALNDVLGIVKAVTAPIREAGARLIGAIADGVSGAATNLYDAIKRRVTALVDGARSILNDVEQVGRSVVLHIGQGIAGAATNLYAAIRGRVDSVLSGARSILDEVETVGRSIVTFIGRGIANAGENLYAAIRGRVDSVISGAKSIIDDMVGVGRSIVSAIGRGIAGAAGLARSAAAAVVHAIDAAIPNSFSVSLGPLGHASIDLPNNPLSDITGLAKGADSFAGGIARVGELGPETVYLPRGARVIPASQSQSQNPQGPLVHIERAEFNSRADLDVFASRLAWQIATR